MWLKRFIAQTIGALILCMLVHTVFRGINPLVARRTAMLWFDGSILGLSTFLYLLKMHTFLSRNTCVTSGKE